MWASTCVRGKGKGCLTCRGLDLDIVYRLHQAGGSHEEGRIADTPRGGDDLAPAPHQGIIRHVCMQDLELHISDGLIAQRSLTGAPLESLETINLELEPCCQILAMHVRSQMHM